MALTADEDLHRFRGSGPDDGQLSALLNTRVDEYAVVERRGYHSAGVGRRPRSSIAGGGNDRDLGQPAPQQQLRRPTSPA
jgi:hypothetical protein